MIVACPSCATRFRLDPLALKPAGRRLKCGRCGHVWHHGPQSGLQSTEAGPTVKLGDRSAKVEGFHSELADTSDHIALDRRTDRELVPAGHYLTHQPRRPHTSWPLVVGWALLFLVVAGLVAGAFAYRHAIAERWPQAAQLYAALGIGSAAPDELFRLRDLETKVDAENGVPAISLSGEMVNVSSRVQRPPRVQIVFQDAEARDIGSRLVEVDTRRLLPGESTRFSWRLENPPARTERINLFLVAGE